jgi:hypothetical protein
MYVAIENQEGTPAEDRFEQGVATASVEDARVACENQAYVIRMRHYDVSPESFEPKGERVSELGRTFVQ